MSTQAQSNAELIATYLDAVIRKDASDVDRFFAPDVEYMVNGTPVPDPENLLPPISKDCHTGLPWLGLHHGKQAVKDFPVHLHRNLEVTAYGPREVISEGNKAAAFGCFRLRSLSTGRTADIAYSIRFELHDRLIAKYHFLENTFDVARAFRTSGEWVLETDGVKHHIPPNTRKNRKSRTAG